MNELKPCPFCGEIPQIETKPLWELSRDGALHGYVGHYKYDIRCQKCGCNVTIRNNTTIYSGHKKARENTIKAWNHRAEQSQTAEVAELKRELERVKQERDAAVKDLDALRRKTGWKCDCCYYNDNHDRYVCGGCDYNNGNNWRWRGAKEE